MPSDRLFAELALLTGAEFEPAPCAWPEIELAAGLAFPDEYKAYIDTFPPGVMRGSLLVYHPRLKGGTGTFVEKWLIANAEFLRVMQSLSPLDQGHHWSFHTIFTRPPAACYHGPIRMAMLFYVG
jgi:hypothetical protein